MIFLSLVKSVLQSIFLLTRCLLTIFQSKINNFLVPLMPDYHKGDVDHLGRCQKLIDY